MDEIGNLVGKPIGQFLDGESAAIGNESRSIGPFEMEREESQHLFFALQMCFGIGKQIASGFVERLSLANAMKDIEDRLVGGTCEPDTIRRANRNTVRPRSGLGALDTCAVFTVLVEMNANRETSSK